MARSRRCIHSGEGPLRTPRTSLSAKAGQSFSSPGAKSSFTFTGQSKLARDGRDRRGLQRPEPGGGEVAGDAGDGGGVGAVGRQVDVDDGVVEPGVGREGDADGRVLGQVDDAFVVVGELQLGGRAQHAVRTRRRG